MKTKKNFTLAFLAAMVLFQSNALATAGNNEVTGKWKYQVPQAPYGYQEGMLILAEKENKLEGEVKFSDGYKIKLKDISFQDGQLKFGLYIDYEYVKVEASVEDSKMKGSVISSEGKMNLTAKKSPLK
jgi:hypothetical protein